MNTPNFIDNVTTLFYYPGVNNSLSTVTTTILTDANEHASGAAITVTPSKKKKPDLDAILMPDDK